VKRPFSIQDLLRIRIPTDFTIAPDGRSVVYALRVLDEDKGEYRIKLWQTDIPDDADTSPSEGVQLTHGPGQDTTPRFSPLGDGVAFLSDRPVDGTDEDEEDKPSRLFWLPFGGGEARSVNDSLDRVHDFVFHPAGGAVFAIADSELSPFERDRAKALAEQRRDEIHEERTQVPRRICCVQLDGGRVETLYDRDYGLVELDVAPDGSRIVFSTNYTGLNNDTDRLDLWLLEAPADGTDHRWHARPLVQRKGACRGARFSPDGRLVAFIAPREEVTELSQSDVWIVTVDGSAPPYNLTEAAGFVGDAEELAWLSDDTLVVQVERGLYAPLWVFSDVRRAMGGEAPAARQLTADPWLIRGFDLDQARKRLVVRAEDAVTPYELYAVDAADGALRAVTDLQSEWADRLRADVRPFRWRSFDGTEVEGALALPPSDESVAEPAQPGGKPPLLLVIHGGPAWHTTLGFSQYLNWHWLAGLGYAVFAPNYRGSIGYGHDFVRANHMDLGGGDYRDIMAGLEAVLATGWVDPNRLGVTGGSYGGYMTNWIIGHDTRFKAAVSEFGIWSLFTDFGCSSSRGWEVMYLGRYWENEALYLERSPARYVQQIQTPVLIIHGDADDNTFVSNSKEMYNALLEAGKTVEFVHYPREGHGLAEPRHREDELTRIARWFQHWLPTGRERRPAVPGEWGRVPDAPLEWRVDGVEETEAFARHGEDYKRVIAVTVSWRPAPDAEAGDGAKTSRSGTKKRRGKEGDKDTGETVRLSVGSPAHNEVFLAWSGTLPHQRPSVLARQEFEPIGISWPGSTALVSGDITLRPDGEGRLVLLFPGRALSFGPLEEFVLLIKEAEWMLRA
jgi:dipeptidyl aminopeptidase/acylaminoacyl peptidase